MPKKDQGITKDRFTIVPRTLIFVFKDTEVLLIKGAPSKRLWANQYNGVGGHIERGEDIVTSARRELVEETGLQAELRLCGTVMIDADQSTGVGVFLFKGHYQSGKLTPSSEGDLEWTALSSLPGLPLVEDLQALLPRIAAWQPDRALIHASYCYNENDRLQITFYEGS
jgi:8-oxo-dGTP diphosphatase